MTVTIRDARPDDREMLVGFVQALNIHEHETRPDRDTTWEGADEHLRSLQLDVKHRDGFFLIGESDGIPAGYLVGTSELEDGTFVVPHQRPYGCILDIYVDDDFRGKGVSRAMMEEAFTRFKALGLPRAVVTGLASNPLANAAYPALGFDLLYNTYEKRLDD